MNEPEIVEHSILLRNGSRVVTPCYVTKVQGTDELIYEPVDRAKYREDTRFDDTERTYLLPGEGVAASDQDWRSSGNHTRRLSR